MKKFIWSVVLIFVLFWALDFLLHGVILTSAYKDTASLWRPYPEMKTSLIWSSMLIYCVVFVWIYSMLGKKGVAAGLKYGLLLGIAYGFSMGYGSYASMPIPMYIASAWFLGTVVKMMFAGLIVGLIIK